MSSLNGDITVLRNGRSTSQVSIYNYPEHLNPFYEEDNHKRLRFWKLGKNGDKSGRRNSFSLGGLKDVWSFKSFRIKKKSSTLGINKTSESPPPLRREIAYDPLSRHTYDTTLPNRNNNFLRSTPLRNSLQTVYQPQTTDESYKGFGLSRNDRYRSTIQTGGNSNSQPSKNSLAPKRYIYGGSATPQPLRTSEFGQAGSLEIISRGSSQVSVYSTNPFESDVDENDVKVEIEHHASSIPKKLLRKKRRAPEPPVSIDEPSSSTKMVEVLPSQKIYLEGDQSSNNLSIIELTAEIESFVATSNANGDVAKSSTLIAELPDKMSNRIITKEIQNIEEIPENRQSDTSENKQTNVHRKNSTYNNEEMGHIECIHIHLDTLKSTENNEPSRVTSFKQISSVTPFTVDRNNESLEIKEANKNYNIYEKNEKVELPRSSNHTTKIENKETKSPDPFEKENDHIVEKVENDTAESRAVVYLEKRENFKSFKPPLATKPSNVVREKENNMKENHSACYLEKDENLKSFKPPLATKPNNIATKIAPEPRLSKISVDTTADLVITETKMESGLCDNLKFHKMAQQKQSIEMPSKLEIVESEEDSSALDIAKDKTRVAAAADKHQMFTMDLIYRPKPASQLEWKKSTLAPLEAKVPPEKRKSVKDIIESINRSQKLLGASANKDQTSHDSLSLLYSDKQYHLDEETTLRTLKQNTQTQTCGPNNDLNQNLRTLDKSPKVVHRVFEETALMDNSDVGKVCNTGTGNDNLRKEYENETIMNGEHLYKKKNDDIFQKCKINKEVYTNRESSPTASNLDWNPVPKPKRAINIPSSELNERFSDQK